MSCKTNKTPSWVTDPPPDDELNIYIVGVGEGDEVYESVIDQIFSRFNITKNSHLSDLLFEILHDETNQDISILDRWSNKDIDYILVRIKRSFFDPILDLYVSRYDEMMSYQNENEITADSLLEDGEIFKAYLSYIKALEFMLNQNDEFYSISILKVFDKLKKILTSISYTDIEEFSLLYLGKPVTGSKFAFKISNSGNEKYDGFMFKVNFEEGWNSRERWALIPIRNNGFKFVPTIPMVSGLSTISSSLEIAELVLLVNNWKAHPTLGNEINQFFTEIEMIKNQSIISFEFNRESDLNSFVKVVSFKNKFVSEGILRYLLDKEDQAVISPILQVEENFLEYIREVNRITDDLYSYMIQEVYINKDVIVVDENSQIIKLEGRFNLIDLKSSTILQTQNISSEFIDRNSDEDLAYLDFGLKVGEIIYNIKF